MVRKLVFQSKRLPTGLYNNNHFHYLRPTHTKRVPPIQHIETCLLSLNDIRTNQRDELLTRCQDLWEHLEESDLHPFYELQHCLENFHVARHHYLNEERRLSMNKVIYRHAAAKMFGPEGLAVTEPDSKATKKLDRERVNARRAIQEGVETRRRAYREMNYKWRHVRKLLIQFNNFILAEVYERVPVPEEYEHYFNLITPLMDLI